MNHFTPGLCSKAKISPEGCSPNGSLVRPGLPASQSTGVLQGHLAGPKKTSSFPRSLHEKNVALFVGIPRHAIQ